MTDDHDGQPRSLTWMPSGAENRLNTTRPKSDVPRRVFRCPSRCTVSLAMPSKLRNPADVMPCRGLAVSLHISPDTIIFAATAAASIRPASIVGVISVAAPRSFCTQAPASARQIAFATRLVADSTCVQKDPSGYPVVEAGGGSMLIWFMRLVFDTTPPSARVCCTLDSCILMLRSVKLPEAVSHRRSAVVPSSTPPAPMIVLDPSALAIEALPNEAVRAASASRTAARAREASGRDPATREACLTAVPRPVECRRPARRRSALATTHPSHWSATPSQGPCGRPPTGTAAA